MNPYPFPNVIDSSMLADFKACPHKFYFTYICSYKPKGQSVHLHAGAAFAEGMKVARTEFFVNGRSADESVALGLQALLEFYGDFQCPPDSAKSAERMSGAFEFYFERYPLGGDGTEPITFPGGRRGIEFSFAEPLPIINPSTGDPLIYSGRMDAILSALGGIFLCDEKTTTQLGPTWPRQWDLRSQFTGYKWGTEKNGIHIDGVIVRGVSILKTKFDTLQAVSYRPDWQVDRWYEELLGWIQDMVRCYETGKWRHNLDHSCAEYGGCTYRQVCATRESEQLPWIETYFERRQWDPITGKETLLGPVVEGQS
jgi:hypothetical protein